MEEKRVIYRIANGNFPFRFWIEKAVASEEMGKMVLEGVASTGNVDHDGERMSKEAMVAMAEAINSRGVPLRIEHSQNDNAIVGLVDKAWVDERNQMWIKATLHEDHPASHILYDGLKKGVSMGLSVGGFVKRAVEEMVEGVGKTVKTFYDIVLDEVSVTKHPSNYDARVYAKSRIMDVGESDYLQAFAKSIPESEWRIDKNYKSFNNDKSIMEKDKTTKVADESTEETKKAAEDTEETKKTSDKKDEETVTKAEFNELVKMVSQGFNAMTKAFSKAMSAPVLEQANPDKSKVVDLEQPKAKAQGGDAVDGEQPDKKKEDNQPTAKTAADGSDEDGTREKSSKEDDTYDLATVQRAIKAIEAVGKAVEDSDDKTTKAEDDKDDKTTKAEDKDEKTTKSISSIDKFVIAVADTIEKMEKSMKKNGFQTDHLAKSMVESIRSNPAYQDDIRAMLQEPGAKKSVINGTPFVKMRDGRSFKVLSLAHPAEKVEKSKDGKDKSFKDTWGKDFSSVRSEE